jgi:hypothetical protein
MHFCFDNSSRLKRRTYYLEYAGVRFKLVQNNPRKWADVLMTIVPVNDLTAAQKAYSAASEFLSALSWENGSRISVEYCYGFGVPKGATLRESKPRGFSFPQVPFSGHAVGYDLWRIPHVENESQRVALTLFREASSSNKMFLSFLFYWQILEVGGGDAISWATKAQRGRVPGLALPVDDLRRLPLAGRPLGNYLNDDCRHAIAHIRRRPGKKVLEFDVSVESRRLAVSTKIAQRLARHYIRAVLRVNKTMYLVRKGGRGFPCYVPEEWLSTNHGVVLRA